MKNLREIIEDQDEKTFPTFLSEEQSEVHKNILTALSRSGLSIVNAHEVCLICAQDVLVYGTKQPFTY